MKRLLTAAIFVGLAATVGGAVFRPRVDMSSDINASIQKRGLRAKQRTSWDLYWTFTRGATALDLTGADAVTFTYSDGTWSQVVTGAVNSATGGVVKVLFTPAVTDTNGVYNFDLTVSSGGVDVVIFPYGQLDLLARADSGANGTFPTTTNVVDASAYTWVNVPWATLAGDVTGSYSNNTVVKLRNRSISTNAPTDTQVLAWQSSTSTWVPTNATAGSGDLTAVQVSGGLLTVTSGTGPIPIVGLTTASVQGAQSPEADTLATVVARGNTTGGNNILLDTGTISGGNAAMYTVGADTLQSGIDSDVITLGDNVNGAENTISNASFTGNGSGLTNLNGTAIASGTVADARIASTIARDTELAAYLSLAGGTMVGALDMALQTLKFNSGDDFEVNFFQDSEDLVLDFPNATGTHNASTRWTTNGFDVLYNGTEEYMFREGYLDFTGNIASGLQARAYNATTWDGSTIAVTEDGIRDKIESLGSSPWSTNATGAYYDGAVSIGTNAQVSKFRVVNTTGDDSFRVDDQAGDATPFLIDNSGNVRIGGAYFYPPVFIDLPANARIRTSDTDTGLFMYSNKIGVDLNTSDYFYIIGATELCRMTYAGDFGIGTDTPAAKLHVNGAIALNVVAEPTANTNRCYLFVTNSTSAELNIMDGEGNVTQVGYVDPTTQHEQLNTYNQWTGEGVSRDIDNLITAVEKIAAAMPELAIDTTKIRWDTRRPAKDWDAEQARLVAKRDMEIAAWQSDTNSVDVKGPKPGKKIKAKKPKWLKDWKKGK